MEYLSAAIKPVLFVLRAFNRMLKIIPAADEFEERIRLRWFPSVIVRRVTDPTDPDLHAALALYEKRLDGDLRFQSSDIIRWLEDDLHNRESKGTAPRDYFLVAKYRRKVRAFVLFHYYPLRKIAFFAYMVVDSNTAGLGVNELSQALISRISRMLLKDPLLRDCKSLSFETKDPRSAPQANQLHDIARIQRFCSLAATRGFTLRAFDIAYLQPISALPVTDARVEQSLLLISARDRNGDQSIDTLKEIRELLDFIYLDLYPEGFSDIPEEQQAYQEYCRTLHDRVLNGLPAKITIINPAHLTCGRAVRKRYRRSAGCPGPQGEQ